MMEETTWKQDWSAGNVDQIIKRTKKILFNQFHSKKLSSSDAKYWSDYVAGVGTKKPAPKL